jgi:hypothetical protein
LGAEQAEESLNEPRSFRVSGVERFERSRRKNQRRFLAEPNGVIDQAYRFAGSRFVGVFAVQPANCLEKIEREGLAFELSEEVYRT